MGRPQAMVFPRGERVQERRRDADDRKLRDEFFDHPTLLAISRLISRGLFESVDYPIATGKEGGVFRASGAGGFRAVKVYRIGNSVFRSLPPYVLEEFRREVGVGGFAQLISAWTRREHTILTRLHEAGVRVPEPLGYLRNVLVMELVGTPQGVASGRLKDAAVRDPDALRTQFALQVRRMVLAAHLVHGDLSQYNVLEDPEGGPVFIDVAQAIPTDHPQARALLERDLRTFARFFGKLGADGDFEKLWRECGGAELPPPKR
ncbi:MAG: serine protein kinase RIO [Thermoplasmata archaeon]|nr:serine protein kinase RIO [Thermoplasmata archaeon]